MNKLYTHNSTDCKPAAASVGGFFAWLFRGVRKRVMLSRLSWSRLGSVVEAPIYWRRQATELHSAIISDAGGVFVAEAEAGLAPGPHSTKQLLHTEGVACLLNHVAQIRLKILLCRPQTTGTLA